MFYEHFQFLGTRHSLRKIASNSFIPPTESYNIISNRSEHDVRSYSFEGNMSVVNCLQQSQSFTSKNDVEIPDVSIIFRSYFYVLVLKDNVLTKATPTVR